MLTIYAPNGILNPERTLMIIRTFGFGPTEHRLLCRNSCASKLMILPSISDQSSGQGRVGE